MNADLPLSDKVALITGGSRGIGKAIALEFAALGAKVVATATTESGANVISEYLSVYPNCQGMVLNVCNKEQIDQVISTIEQQVGNISILVNNAGITQDNLSMRMKDEEWESVINTNLTSVFRISRALLRSMMKARYGRIINITSVVGHLGNPGQANYCAAKAGLGGLTRSLARELGSRNITVNSVAPGFIDTDMTRSLEEKQRDSLLGNIPLGRFGKPQDVAKAVAFLASDSASYISGTTIHVNGGMYMD